MMSIVNIFLLSSHTLKFALEDIMIYFRYSNRWNIKNGHTDCGEPQLERDIFIGGLFSFSPIVGSAKLTDVCLPAHT